MAMSLSSARIIATLRTPLICRATGCSRNVTAHHPPRSGVQTALLRSKRSGNDPDITLGICQTGRMHTSLRASAAVLATALLLVACGTASESESGATLAPDAGAAPVTQPAVTPTETPDAGDIAPQDEVVDPSTPAAVAPEASVTSDPAPAVEVPASAAPPPTEAPAPVEAVLGGRAFASELAAESDFAENMLPDLQVDDIRSGQKVNIRNVFPAERPVLMWMWAPH